MYILESIEGFGGGRDWNFLLLSNEKTEISNLIFGFDIDMESSLTYFPVSLL